MFENFWGKTLKFILLKNRLNSAALVPVYYSLTWCDVEWIAQNISACIEWALSNCIQGVC